MHQGSGTAGILTRLRFLLPELPDSLRITAEHILNDPRGAVSGTIGDLARAADTSTGAVSRLCRRLGLDGYPALRIAVAEDSGSRSAEHWNVDVSRGIDPGAPLTDVVRTLEAVQARAVHDTLAALDLPAVTALARAIGTARRVHVYGVSGSAIMARELALRLSRIGVPCWTYADVHDGLAGAAQLSDTDAALAVSHSGHTAETLAMLQCANEQGATTAVITSAHRSPLADLAEHVLLTTGTQTLFQDGPLAARHAELAVIEVLYVAVGQLTYERTVDHLARTAQAITDHRRDRPTIP
ncbi:MurR/RpiR family transcriptional regulator [Ruania zhangjianzhongii]|uniref:MurR/RpiR family transcriptional regulator n=1 Tax=Ruania zhangjianzhongii TaxID=2603206 RepID=UPI0011CC0EC5|nr:MurR/RpiR family transcriptional regulator [Ruania zhangjianzhongii]